MKNQSQPSASASIHRRAPIAFLFAVPIAILGGLIGLGGAEFRLPVLAGVLRHPARQAVPLNLTVSLITILTALLIRGRTLSFATLSPWLPVMFALILGAIIAAFWGASFASQVSNEQLERLILILLVVIGTALIIEGFLPHQVPALIPAELNWQIPAGILFGLAIGLVSSLLGVAGGEVIIPTLIFAFGVNIVIAGSASLWVSLPTVSVGLLKYAKRGALNDRAAWESTIAPMGVGSILGALIGGILVGIISESILKIGLGLILIFSALRVFHHSRSQPAQEP